MIIDKARFAHLLLLLSERAWAQAMHVKTIRSAESSNSEIRGSTKDYILSRLTKASTHAKNLLDLLRQREQDAEKTEDVLEARAYYIGLRGAIAFEKKDWSRSLHENSEVRFLYAYLMKLASSQREERFRDLLSTLIDPSIRYAAYQSKIPRTVTIERIVSRHLPASGNEYVDKIRSLDPGSLGDPAKKKDFEAGDEAKDGTRKIQWRSRSVLIEDAATAQALGAVSTAEASLLSFLSANDDSSRQAKAAAYDQVLIPSQDAVDATKTAIDELTAEGIPQSDRRMQSLQITRTFVNYSLIGWRIGRNRILCGQQDGAVLESDINSRIVKKPQSGKVVNAGQGESTGHKLKRLRERVVLYESSLQSLDSVKDLPGVAADQSFLGELGAKRAYFSALRCLAIARSHIVLEHTKEALALLARGLNLLITIPGRALSPVQDDHQAPNIHVTSTQTSSLSTCLQGLVFQYRALAELDNLDSLAVETAKGTIPPLLVDRLDEYPASGVDLTYLVNYPPKLQPVPVKPIFLDVAYNYIDYPGRVQKTPSSGVNGVSGPDQTKSSTKEGKKGWFGFGR